MTRRCRPQVRVWEVMQKSTRLQAAPATSPSTNVVAAPGAFEVKVLKPQGVTLGLSLQQQSSGLLVEQIFPDGVVALWNSQCKSQRQVTARDMIVSVNGSTDWQQMLDYCSGSGSLNLEFLKGPFEDEGACLLQPLRAWMYLVVHRSPSRRTYFRRMTQLRVTDRERTGSLRRGTPTRDEQWSRKYSKTFG